MSSKKFTIRGRTYNLEDAADLVSIQNVLAPENWPGKKGDAVRLFLALQEMLALQVRRHFAANFKTLAKTALEEGAEGGSARIGATFAFEVDFTSPLVAALTKIKMNFSVKHGTEGKPQTHDLTQGELPLDGDDMTPVFDTKKLAEEKKADEPAPTGDTPPPPDTTGDVTPENTPGDTPPPPPPRSRKGKKN